MNEEQAARDNLLNVLVPLLESLPQRPPRRQGNVTGFQLYGGYEWSKLNNYLLMLEVDIGGEGLVDELSTVLPAGSSVSLVANVELLRTSQPAQA